MPGHDPAWDGPMTGTLRGRPLVRCPRHGGWWTVDRPCPACRLQVEVDKLKADTATYRSKGRSHDAA